MSQLTASAILAIGGPRARPPIAVGLVANLAWLDTFGISQPHRLAHFLAQCGEESDHFKTTREYASGAGYEGRHDLGNTRPGDGVRFAGRGLIQTTGRANYHSFTAWIRKSVPTAPDFETSPALLEQFPWALYSAVWYWTSHDLNRLADDNNIETITHKINGGFNGLGERIAMFTRAGLVLLGYSAVEVKRFQAESGLDPDGIAGKKTREAIFARLKALPAVPIAGAAAEHAPPLAPVPTEAPAIVRPPPAPQEPSRLPTPKPTFWELFLRFLRDLTGQ